jgi:hypothetical protein
MIKIDEEFLENFSAVFENEFETLKIELIAVSTIQLSENEFSSGYVVKTKIEIKNKIEAEKIVWKLRAMGGPGSLAFKEGAFYIAYLNLELMPYLGWTSSKTGKEGFITDLKRSLEEKAQQMRKAWQAKENLLRVIEEYYFPCDIQHGFQCDVPLDDFVFSQIRDVDFFEKLKRLQETYSDAIKLQDGEFIFSLEKCADNKTIIKSLRALMAPPPVDIKKSNDKKPPANDKKEEDVTQATSKYSYKRLHKLAPAAEIEVVQQVFPQKIEWENNDYNRISQDKITPVINFTQLQPITGSLNYIYYPEVFIEENRQNKDVQEQIKQYREMIGHEDSGKGIKELHRNGKLLAYYTSDGKTDTRIVFIAVTKARVPLESNPHKMKTVILLEPYKVCTHEQLKSLDFNHEDLRKSAEILSRKESTASSGSASSSSKILYA